ncbi:MAG: histidine phosphatase family protein [Bacteroidota bacterium]
MSKTLYLVRHAHTESHSMAKPDFERELDNQGLQEAEKIGEKLKRLKVNPQVILASPAFRTTKTAKLIANKLDINPAAIIYPEGLYHADPGTYLEYLADLDAENQPPVSVMIVGHNPTVSDAAGMFANREMDMPTGTCIKITFNTDSWAEVKPANATTEWFEQPNKGWLWS